ncbi:MAG: response regulator [Acidobacteriota bacterium]|nr:response regulator [Acidobacteriota bacterium]
MRDLRAFFREGIVARIKALESAKRALVRGDQSATEAIRRIAHSLRGSGGTYGFPEVTTSAASVEDCAAEDLTETLDALLETLRVVAESGDNDEQSLLLVVEDDPIVCRAIEKCLSEPGRRLIFCKTRDEAEHILATDVVSLVLVDLLLPGHDGRDFLDWLRGRPTTRSVPVFVISAKSTSVTKTECFALGADEFFAKPLDFDALSVAISSRLQRAAEQSHESRLDPLTQLPNRAAFDETFQRAQLLVSRHKTPHAVGILDFDRFKAINDTYGHKMGDEVLCRASEILKETLRASDYIARWGGEEFVVLFPSTDCQGAKVALENALERMRDELFRTDDGEEFGVTFSAGTVDVTGTCTPESSVARADKLMYQAKAAGADRVLGETDSSAPPRRKIVLAEDDDLLAAMIERLLGEEDLDVLRASDGEEALAIAKSTRPSLVLLDIDMPGINGIDVLSQLKGSGFHKQIPVIMLTARTGDDDIVDAFEMGADDYVTKPFSPAELKARVRRFVGRRRRATVH